MELDPHICYRAVRSRDGRFDGRFFTGVLSTGIYCRPVCPARTPRQTNCRFFACAAAAEAAGFRPCLRCRPETSPGTPAWQGTSATVMRALRLIEEGALDGGSVEELAARLGVGARHLRRLFDEHLGAAPRSVARTRRVHFALKLLAETKLPMGQVALAAGFGTVRRFNATIRETMGRAPSVIRRNRAARNEADSTGHLTLSLAYRQPYNWAALVEFLQPRAIPGVETINEDCYRRTFDLEAERGVLEVRPVAAMPGRTSKHASKRSAKTSRPALVLSVPVPAAAVLAEIVARVRRLFDLGADPAVISQHLSGDRELARTVRRRPGLRVPGAWDRFELAVRAILGQQVSVRAATTLAGRLVQRYGEPLAREVNTVAEEDLGWIFPRPEVLASADLTGIGLTGARAETIRGLASAVCDGSLILDASRNLEHAVAQLSALPGIGDWTAQYIAMRALGEPDALPAGDLGLRKAIGGPDPPATAAVLARRAQAWRPWRAYAAMHLWLGTVGRERKR